MLITSSRWVIASALVMLSILAAQSTNTAMGSTRRPRLQRPVVSKSRTISCGQCSGAAKTKRRLRSGAARIEPCHQRGYVDPRIAKNFNSAMRDLKRAGIKPQVTSTWRSSQHQARLHNCSSSRRCRRANPGLYRALPPGQSLHEAGLAVDMSGVAAGPRGAKRLTRRGRRIVGIMRKNGFKWRYGLADPAHFEADPRKAGYRNAKQAIRRSQNICDAKVTANARVDRKPARAHQTTPIRGKG